MVSTPSANGQLGQVVKIYANKTKVRTALIILGIGVVLAVAGYFGNLILLLGLGVVLTLIGLFTLPVALSTMANEVVVYDNGFTFKLGKKTGTIRWEEIRGVVSEARVHESVNPENLGPLFKSDKRHLISYGFSDTIELNSANISEVKKLAKYINEKRPKRAI